MTPLFACFPVCLTFVALGIIAAVVLIFGLAKHPTNDNTPPPGEAVPAGGWELWWVFPLTLLVVAAVMLVLAWYWPE